MTTPTPPVTTPEAAEGMRAALQRIAEYETNWREGVAWNVNELQAIAEQALATWHTRKPLREDARLLEIVGMYGKAEEADEAGVLDALDSHLFPGRAPEKGEPTR